MATHISIPTSAARVGPIIRRGIWADLITTRSRHRPARADRAFRPATFCTTISNRASCPSIIGPVTRGELQYAAMLKVAQRMTKKPVKFGTIGPELVAFAVQDRHYKSLKDRILAITDALNEELHDLADAGCQVIQFEEPQIHLLAVRNIVDDVINPAFSSRSSTAR